VSTKDVPSGDPAIGDAQKLSHPIVPPGQAAGSAVQLSLEYDSVPATQEAVDEPL
jgi:hypothetical protein